MTFNNNKNQHLNIHVWAETFLRHIAAKKKAPRTSSVIKSKNIKTVINDHLKFMSAWRVASGEWRAHGVLWALRRPGGKRNTLHGPPQSHKPKRTTKRGGVAALESPPLAAVHCGC